MSAFEKDVKLRISSSAITEEHLRSLNHVPEYFGSDPALPPLPISLAMSHLRTLHVVSRRWRCALSERGKAAYRLVPLFSNSTNRRLGRRMGHGTMKQTGKAS